MGKQAKVFARLQSCMKNTTNIVDGFRAGGSREFAVMPHAHYTVKCEMLTVVVTGPEGFVSSVGEGFSLLAFRVINPAVLT